MGQRSLRLRRKQSTYGIKITSPDEGEVCDGYTTIEGRYDTFPPEGSLWIVNTPDWFRYWPQIADSITFDKARKRWRAASHVHGDTFIAATVVGESGQTLFRYYKKASKEAFAEVNIWPAIENLPEDVVRCDDVWVRKSPSLGAPVGDATPPLEINRPIWTSITQLPTRNWELMAHSPGTDVLASADGGVELSISESAGPAQVSVQQTRILAGDFQIEIDVLPVRSRVLRRFENEWPQFKISLRPHGRYPVLLIAVAGGAGGLSVFRSYGTDDHHWHEGTYVAVTPKPMRAGIIRENGRVTMFIEQEQRGRVLLSPHEKDPGSFGVDCQLELMLQHWPGTQFRVTKVGGLQ